MLSRNGKLNWAISFLEDHHQEHNHNVDEKEIKAISKIDHEPAANKLVKLRLRLRRVLKRNIMKLMMMGRKFRRLLLKMSIASQLLKIRRSLLSLKA